MQGPPGPEKDREPHMTLRVSLTNGMYKFIGQNVGTELPTNYMRFIVQSEMKPNGQLCLNVWLMHPSSSLEAGAQTTARRKLMRCTSAMLTVAGEEMMAPVNTADQTPEQACCAMRRFSIKADKTRGVDLMACLKSYSAGNHVSAPAAKAAAEALRAAKETLDGVYSVADDISATGADLTAARTTQMQALKAVGG